jgi:hypothetical protein
MSTEISTNILKKFIIKTIGADKLAEKQANKFDIDADKFEDTDIDENNYLDIDEILDDSDLYEQFATLYVEEQDKKADKKDEEKEKEENLKIKDKNGAGV